MYSIQESALPVVVCIISNTELERDVSINLALIPVTAEGED